MLSTLTTLALFLLVPCVYAPGKDATAKTHKATYPALATTIKDRTSEFDSIPAERRKQLDRLARIIRETLKKNGRASLVFICTHNSRQSHLSQIWAATAAHYYGVKGIHTYSGGTETTAFNPRAVAALERAGFKIEKTTDDDDPIYHVRFSDDAHPLTCFSKVYDEAPNPTKDFIAVITCEPAVKACPTVHGASDRVELVYKDPKEADGTPRESKVYDDCCMKIGREILYVFSRI